MVYDTGFESGPAGKLRSDLKIEKTAFTGQGLCNLRNLKIADSSLDPRLQEYDFEIQHRKGPLTEMQMPLSVQESCKHCSNAEKFGIEIDTSIKVLTTTSCRSRSS
ncbi:hypothetical protein AVEN_27694-1 [Araneus ventricosus]|uniref:Uncharacterized protein n=1 Tax=Araneus ventricosus TaxID=182803 RepID=A0A4Y2MIX0_ARAVE|nr:hypothetical protein AVEN_27694-1 [Araneus ventricosus]